MKLTFFGTKGYVEEHSPTHFGHSTFTIEYRGFRLLCDFGENRKGLLREIRPDAIFVSHAHPDHAWGLDEGTEAPVYASEATHEILKNFPIPNREVLSPGAPAHIGPFRLTAIPVAHSVRCPCTAARIEAGKKILVYSGDIVSFDEPGRALGGASLYVGDGSTLRGSLVRRHKSGALIGHTTVRAQLGWLAKAGVTRAIFSHFGKGPIEMGDAELRKEIAALAAERAPKCGVEAASDGAEFEV